MRAELYRSLRETDVPAKAVADALGVSVSYLTRCVLTGPSAVKFPLDLVAAFMLQTGSCRVLEHIAREVGYVAVPVRRVRQTRKRPLETLNEMAAEFHALAGALFAFAERPDAATAAGIRRRLRRHLADMAALDVAIAGNLAQLELELEVA